MTFALGTSAQGVLDVHSHLITSDFLAALKQENRLIEEGFPLPKYDAEAHLKWMDEAGIQTSVLTLAAPQPGLDATPAERKDIIRQANEAAALLKKQHPGRFLFCAALPLPDVGAAIKEAKYALDSLKADGIKLATNVDGQYLGAPELDTLFAFLNERAAVVILHPHRPQPVNQQVMQQTPLAMQEYLSETTRAVANMLTRNVPCRYPNVKLIVPHLGAYLPIALPRMKSLAPVMQQTGLVGDIDWEANLASLYFDLAGSHSPEAIRTLLSITSPSHLLYGSDFPYAAPAALSKGLNRMRQYLTDEPDLAPFKEMILHGNAEKLFGLSATDAKPEQQEGPMIVRIAEIEVVPEHLEEYLAIAGEVDRLSMEREPGVICLFPMQSDEAPNRIRILEIYASEEAYQKHLRTEHFQRYKQGTLHMVKDLKLPLMQPLDQETMKLIFKKYRK